MLCKGRCLCIPKFKLINPEGENPLPYNIIGGPVSVHSTIDSTENEARTFAEKNEHKKGKVQTISSECKRYR